MNILKRLPVLALSALVVSLVLVGSKVTAEDSNTPTDTQLSQIRTRCSEIQATLSRIHANDALLRVNRGQLYERLSTKLTVPLNSRIALNRLDGSSLLTVTSNYDQHLDDFRSRYQTYEEQLSTTMRIDCTKQPAKFYDSLQDARVKRRAVYDATQNLAKDITDYKQAFTEFTAAYKEKNE